MAVIGRAACVRCHRTKCPLLTADIWIMQFSRVIYFNTAVGIEQTWPVKIEDFRLRFALRDIWIG